MTAPGKSEVSGAFGGSSKSLGPQGEGFGAGRASGLGFRAQGIHGFAGVH